MSVAVHLIKAFADSRARNMELAQTWVNVSFRIGALLPESLLSYAVQREGEVDVLLRSIEDEVADLIRSDDQRGGFLHHY